jgi:hypothetical protein
MRSDLRSRAALSTVAASGLLVLGAVLSVAGAEEPTPRRRAEKEKPVDPAVLAAAGPGEVITPDTPPGARFSPEVRLGFTAGDQWEPAIAADGKGNVYVLYPQYGGVPGCDTCGTPTMVLVVSRDGGSTWEDPAPISLRTSGPGGDETAGGQWDAQIVVDPADGRVYAAWLQDDKSVVIVARSKDAGEHFESAVANATRAATDKPILLARGGTVHVAYNHAQKLFISTHVPDADDRFAFASTALSAKKGVGWSLACGGAIASDGTVYFSWAGYTQNGGGKGPVNLYLTRLLPGRAWEVLAPFATSGSPPACTAYDCGWAYLGAQATVACDTDPADPTLYALWSASPATLAGAPERIFFARSTDRGATWSAAQDVTAGFAPAGTNHAFPAIAAGGRGDVRIAWMDDRASTSLGDGSSLHVWNTYYRASLDHGASWGDEADLSSGGTEAYRYAEGFRFPFGDYFQIAIAPDGTTHAVWGEGYNYDTPGSIWYARGR